MTTREKIHFVSTVLVSVAAYYSFVAFSLLYNNMAWKTSKGQQSFFTQQEVKMNTRETIKLLTKALLCVAIYFAFVASPLFINAIA